VEILDVIDLSKILDVKGFSIEGIEKMEPDNEDDQNDTTISSVVLKFPGDLHNLLFNNFANEFVTGSSQDLFRYKGVMSFKGCNKKIIF